jgi:type IV pilus assembly protein PilV
MRSIHSSGRPAQQGFTLIEVMVAVLIFAFGVLGIVGMQARAAQFSVQAEDRARAALLANEIVTQMWAQQSTSLDEAKFLVPWKKRVGDELPGGAGKVEAGEVTVTWHPPSRAKADPDYRLVTKVVMP